MSGDGVFPIAGQCPLSLYPSPQGAREFPTVSGGYHAPQSMETSVFSSTHLPQVEVADYVNKRLVQLKSVCCLSVCLQTRVSNRRLFSVYRFAESRLDVFSFDTLRLTFALQKLVYTETTFCLLFTSRHNYFACKVIAAKANIVQQC